MSKLNKLPTLTELHHRALKEKWAVPHFNFSSLSQLNGIIDALREYKSPALLGLSEGERNFVGLKQAVNLVRGFQEEGLSVFLNADHSHSMETAKAAFDAGFDSINIDVSKKSFKDNLKETKEVVNYIKNQSTSVEVEGELGYLVTDSSKVYKEKIEIPRDSYTSVEKAIEYVEKTSIDRFTPAIGNLHGIAANEPKIDFDLVEDLRKALPNITFVLHGGSGISDDDMKKLISMGFNNVHVNTEIRIAYTDALRKKLDGNKDEIAPYHYLDAGREATATIIKEKIELFGSKNRL